MNTNNSFNRLSKKVWKSLKCIHSSQRSREWRFLEGMHQEVDRADFVLFVHELISAPTQQAMQNSRRWLRLITIHLAIVFVINAKSSAYISTIWLRLLLQIYALIPWLTDYWLFEQSNIRTVVFHLSCSKLWECALVADDDDDRDSVKIWIYYHWMYVWDEWAWWCGICNLFILGHTLNLIHIWSGMCVKTNSSCSVFCFFGWTCSIPLCMRRLR